MFYGIGEDGEDSESQEGPWWNRGQSCPLYSHRWQQTAAKKVTTNVKFIIPHPAPSPSSWGKATMWTIANNSFHIFPKKTSQRQSVWVHW